MRRVLAAFAILALCTGGVRGGEDTRSLISWLLADGRSLKDIPFAEVIEAATGTTVQPVDPSTDAAWLDRLAAAVDRTMRALNAPGSPIRSATRVNEASRFVEETLAAELSDESGWKCDVPTTPDGDAQRSGYPDLRLVLPDGSVVYLDPKLHASDSRESTLRTFYYEPKTLTNKVRENARHILVGLTHNDMPGDGLRIVGWELVDLSRLRVQLKAEFQAANRDLYGGGKTLRRSTNQ